MIKCAGRTKVESIENPEKTSNCIKQAEEVMTAMIWWQEDLGKAEGTSPPTRKKLLAPILTLEQVHYLCTYALLDIYLNISFCDKKLHHSCMKASLQ